jgi:uncharacterized RDD family membrane protein YckC
VLPIFSVQECNRNAVKHLFDTSAGPIEVVVHEDSRIVSASRLNDERRPVASVMESWDGTDLADLLAQRLGVPAAEASEIAYAVTAAHPALRFAPPPIESPVSRLPNPEAVHVVGVTIRFVALLLDAIIVFFPLSIVVGLLSGGGYAENGRAGVLVSGKGFWVNLLLGFGYYVLAEGLTGRTLGKRIVGIRVVSEEGEQVGLEAALVRNVLRIVDGLFFYLVGALFAFTSPRGQRLGDRAAHTLVVRRA